MTDEETKNLPTNEEIIDELTKDLESHCIKSEPDKIAETEEKVFSGIDDEDTEESEAETKKLPFDDFIDETHLKEEQSLLSTDELETRKTDSDILKQKGNEEFKIGNYLDSINLYTTALRLCPLSYVNERSVLYSNRSASKIKLQNYNESALEDCTKALELNPNYVKALYRRSKLYEDMDKLDEAVDDYKKLLTLDESNMELKHIIYVLGEKITKRNEEMKTEMMGKLKDLGNLILKPFGLSTENFQLNQNSESGGYSVNFVQNNK